MKTLILLITFVLISGCTGIPVSSVYKMMTANPLDFEPGEVAVAIRRTDIVQMNTGDVIMRFTIHSKEPALSVREPYYLEIDNSPDLPVISNSLKTDEALTLLRLSVADLTRFKQLQQTMKQHLKNGGTRKDFGFSVQVVRGCKTTSLLPEDVFVSLYLRLDSDSDFFPLYQDFNIGQANLSPLKSLQEWELCEQSQ